MKQITQVLKAGLLPERMINDGRVSTFGRVLFPILTLYAVPDETGEEWEFDLAECSEKWLPIGAPKVKEILEDLSKLGYVEDLSIRGKSAVFSFPEWVMGMLTAHSNPRAPLSVYFEEKENPPSPPFVKGGKEDVIEEAAVARTSPPAGYSESKARKDAKYQKCKAKIKPGDRYFKKLKGDNTLKFCGACAGGEGKEKSAGEIPFREAREAMEKVQEEFIKGAVKEAFTTLDDEHRLLPHEPEKGNSWRMRLPRDQALIGLVGADMSIEIIRALHGAGNVVGDAFEVIDLTRGIIVNYLEVMPEI